LQRCAKHIIIIIIIIIIIGSSAYVSGGKKKLFLENRSITLEDQNRQRRVDVLLLPFRVVAV
jgi:hypothetical protein